MILMNDVNANESAAVEMPNSQTRRSKRSHSQSRITAKSMVLVVVLIIGTLLLWPAKWGGVTGIVIVEGHSMEPTFHTGDVIITLKSFDYHVGDIIAYEVSDNQIGQGGHVIHRIASVKSTADTVVYQTKGDNNPDPDPWTVSKNDIYGKKIIQIPNLVTVMRGTTASLIVGGILAILVIFFIWPNKKEDKGRHSRDRPSETAD